MERISHSVHPNMHESQPPVTAACSECSDTHPSPNINTLPPHKLTKNVLPFLKKQAPPIFDRNNTPPPAYLCDLEEYFDEQNYTQDSQRLTCLKHGMKNEKNWFKLFSKRFKSYSDFKQQFIERFWSSEDQEVCDKLLFTEKYDSTNRTESLVEFANRQIDHAKDCFPDMSFSEILRRFAKLFSAEHVAFAILLSTDEESLFQTLKKIDHYRKPAQLSDCSSAQCIAQVNERRVDSPVQENQLNSPKAPKTPIEPKTAPRKRCRVRKSRIGTYWSKRGRINRQ
jgi:hypothetical protein